MGSGDKSANLRRVGLSARAGNTRRTKFDELVVAQEFNNFSLPSQWGDLALRNKVQSENSGAVAGTDSGEYSVSTGATANSTAMLESNRAGSYVPGTSAVAGLGVRLGDVLPSADGDVARWGYYDDGNGFGWQYTHEGLGVFYRRDGEHTTILAADFTEDSFDGTGVSGLDLDVSQPLIYQIEYTWYGAGEIAFAVAKRPRSYQSNRLHRQMAHVVDPYAEQFGGPSVLQPNLPFRCEVSNAGSGDDIKLFVTGRSFRAIGQNPSPELRVINDHIVDYTLSTQGAWEPIIAIRKKPTFNGFANRINVEFFDAISISDEDTTFRVTFGDAIDDQSTTWQDPSTWGGDSAIEVAKASGGLAVSNAGFQVKSSIVRAAADGPGQGGIQAPGAEDFSVALGLDTALVVWARQDSASTTTVSTILSARAEY